MAPDATIRIRILGGIKAALEATTVSRAMDRLSDETDEAARAAVRATMALKRLDRALVRTQVALASTSIGFRRLSLSMTATSIIAWSLASIALPALVVALYNVAGATLLVATAFTGALMASLIVAGVMALSVVDRFKQMSGVIGSAANDLKNAGYLVRGAFRDSTAKGADALMRGLARGLTKLAPLLRSLESSFTAMGQAFGSMFDHLFGVLADMGPELRVLFARLVPVIRSTGQMLGSMLRLFVQIATVGAPLLADAFDWLSKKMDGWTGAFTDEKIRGALGSIKSFVAGVKSFVNAFMGPLRSEIGPAMREFGVAWKDVGDDLGRTLGAIVAGFIQFGRDVLPHVVAGIRLLSSVVGNNGDRTRALLTVLVTLGITLKALTVTFGLVKAAYAAWTIASGLATSAMWSLNAAVLANPLGALIVGVVAVGAAFYAAYQNIKLFRDAVNEVGSQIGLGPTAAKKPTTKQRIIQGGLRGAAEQIPGIGPIIKGLPHHAMGGTMTRGGWTEVGEQGKEAVYIPKAASIFPAAESRALASHDRPQAGGEQSKPLVVYLQPIHFQADGRTIASVVERVHLNDLALEG